MDRDFSGSYCEIGPTIPVILFALRPRLYAGCIRPFFSFFVFSFFFFSRLPFSPVAFFPPGESLFFSVESTPENSRRHLVAELLITASLRASNPASLFLRFFFFFFLCLFFFFFFFFYTLRPRISTYVCTYVRTYVRTAVAIVAFRALDCSARTNETRPFAWCRLANGVASRRIAPLERVGWGGGVGGT